MKKLLFVMIVFPVMAFAFTYGYKNNARTGQPDMVVTGANTSDISGLTTDLAGKVTSVSGTSPITSTGGTTPSIGIGSLPYDNLSTAVRSKVNVSSPIMTGNGSITGSFGASSMYLGGNTPPTSGQHIEVAYQSGGVIITYDRNTPGYLKTTIRGKPLVLNDGAVGKVLINTTTDNGVDYLQVNGGVTATTLKQSSGGRSGRNVCWKTATTFGFYSGNSCW